jgi:hypothetical protein
MGHPDGFPDASPLGAAYQHQRPGLLQAGVIRQEQPGLDASDDVPLAGAVGAPARAPLAAPCVERSVDQGLDAQVRGVKSLPALAAEPQGLCILAAVRFAA